MLDTELQTRFARQCTDAAFGYARAASAAYSALAEQNLSFWASAARASADAYTPRSDGRYPVAPARQVSVLPTPLEMWQRQTLDLMKLSTTWGTPPYAQAFGASPVAWWGAFPLRANPATWPMAYAMMVVGVPSAVAWPAAEANTAALDAADTAAETINQAFASYRTESGFAVAPIMSPRRMMMAAFLAPLGTAGLAWPFGSTAPAFW